MSRARIPIACTLETSDYGKRLGQWANVIKDGLIERTDTTSGLRLVFVPTVEGEVERLAMAERECCGFATWLVSRDSEGQVVLDVAAEGMGAEAVRSMFT